MQPLNRTTTNQPISLPSKILQFGGGNFLRAFTDWIVEVLNKETSFNGGIVLVKPTERGDYEALRKQDGLYHVLLEGIKKGEFIQDNRLITCINEVIHPYRAFDQYLASAANPDMRFVISNTTEAGIVFREEDLVANQCPKEFPGKLTIWLYKRFKHFNGAPDKGCIMLPLELIEQNGDHLKESILQYAEYWQLGATFLTWVKEHNTFCNTLVDRIVSGYPNDKAREIKATLGFEDELLVAGEYYHSWVIQGPAFVQDELPVHKTNLNVQFVEDLTPYREIKVRILNGAHTSMVPVGYLLGVRTVYEAMQHSALSKYIEELLEEEVIPTLAFQMDQLMAFKEDVLDRFRNPSIKHQLISIALNSVSKFRTRLLPSLLSYVDHKNELPTRTVLALSALIRFYKGNFNGEDIPIKDSPSNISFFQNAWEKVDNTYEGVTMIVKTVLGNRAFWGKDLNEINGLADLVTQNLMDIEAGRIIGYS